MSISTQFAHKISYILKISKYQLSEQIYFEK